MAEPKRSFLGRWASRGSADVYIRTACRVVEKLQQLVIQKAQLYLEGGPDYFGEEHVLKDYEQHLLAACLGEEDATSAKERLTVCNFALDPSFQEDTRAIARFADGKGVHRAP